MPTDAKPPERLLDHEIVFEDGQWLIWTPDTTGGVIGVGKTELEAKADAVKNMEYLCEILMGIRT